LIKLGYFDIGGAPRQFNYGSSKSKIPHLPALRMFLLVPFLDPNVDTHNQPFQYVVDVILRIVMIPASEARAERVISRQKSICNDRRTKSRSHLLKARYWVSEAIFSR
jgi:hypothetical protein